MESRKVRRPEHFYQDFLKKLMIFFHIQIKIIVIGLDFIVADLVLNTTLENQVDFYKK